MHKPTINGRLAICLAACVAGATLAAPIALGAPSRSASAAAATPAGTAASGAPATAAAAAMPAPMTAQQVIALLERTIQWYRDQRSERDIATQPDDWPILSQDARIAQQVVSSTFDIARADAAMIALTGSPEAAVAGGAATAGVFQLKTRLTADRKSIDAETAQVRAQLARARGARRATLTAQISELRGERDLADARLGIIDSMAEFVGTGGAGTNSLKMQIEAMATGLPGSVTHARGGSRSAPAGGSIEAPVAPMVESAAPTGNGLWQCVRAAWQLAAQRDAVDARIGATVALQNEFARARTPLFTRVKALAARGDALAAEADHADAAELALMRPQLDTLAADFRRMSSLLIPFGRSYVLLPQYLANLRSWRAAIDHRYRDSLIALGVRVGMLALVLAAVFVAAEFWRRAVFRYAHDARRRHQFLVVRAITLWTLVLLIIGIAFASELRSVATLAGLITAGVAVAMQSVIVSIVGYFFLIGKYGLRVGDRVQIGDVTGEVIHIGLVRLQLMELSGEGKLGPTGRVVGFANSIVFQGSGGLFKHIPGVEIAWHEIKLTLPQGADPVESKSRLLQAVNEALGDYRGEIERQAAEIHKATASKSVGGAEPRVQLQFGATTVDALVRYPVHLAHAAEIDERVSKALIEALGRPAAAT